jgi:hypothetical protein
VEAQIPQLLMLPRDVTVSTSQPHWHPSNRSAVYIRYKPFCPEFDVYASGKQHLYFDTSLSIIWPYTESISLSSAASRECYGPLKRATAADGSREILYLAKIIEALLQIQPDRLRCRACGILLCMPFCATFYYQDFKLTFYKKSAFRYRTGWRSDGPVPATAGFCRWT